MFSLQIVAAKARKTYGRKNQNAILRAELAAAGMTVTDSEFVAFAAEIDRQNKLHDSRQKVAGTYQGGRPGTYDFRQPNRFGVQAEINRSNRARAAAEAQVRAGQRDAETMRVAGLGHLVGCRLEISKRGSVGVVVGNKVIAMTARECELLGVTAGPANF